MTTTVVEEAERLLGRHRHRRSRKLYRVTAPRQLLELEEDTVIKVDGQRTTAGMYGSCFRIVRLFTEGYRIEITQ